MILNIIKDQKIDLFGNKAVVMETDMAERETKAIMDRVLDLGDGDIVIGTSRAIEAGVLDMPFATTQRTLSRVLGVRDARGACRYLEFGNLPIPDEIKEFHREKVAEREKLEGKKADYHNAVRDLWGLSKGKIVGIPPYDQ